MDTDNWVVEIKGPQGVKLVEVPAGQVRIMQAEHNDDPYQTAAYLAYADLWMQQGRPV